MATFSPGDPGVTLEDLTDNLDGTATISGPSPRMRIGAQDAGAGKAFDPTTASDSLQGAPVQLANPNPVAITSSSLSSAYAVELAFDTDLPLTGAEGNTSWLSGSVPSNQCITVDLGAEYDILGFDIDNFHNAGDSASTTAGAKNTIINASTNASLYNNTYGDNTGGTQVFNGIINQHVASDVVDTQRELIPKTTARYIKLDIADNWGQATFVGIRQVTILIEGTPPTAGYRWSTNAGATDRVPASPVPLATYADAANRTDQQFQAWDQTLTGDIGGITGGFTILTYSPDVTPPGVPEVQSTGKFGSDPNLGAVTHWTEPVDVDFDYVTLDVNINSAGWQTVDDSNAIGGATSMKFCDCLQGISTEAAGYRYSNEYARNGYAEGTTWQARTKAFDTTGNGSAYSVGAIKTLTDSTAASSPPQLDRIVPTDGGFDLYYTASNEADTIYARTRRESKSLQWDARSEVFKRVGSGVISVTGLINGVPYDLSGEEYNGINYSEFGNVVNGAPDADANATSRYQNKINIRDNTALTALQIAQNLGDTATFTNTGETAVTVYIIPDTLTQTLDVKTDSINLREVDIVVPRQTNFPPDEFFANATITFAGRSYQIGEVQFDHGTIEYSGIFGLPLNALGDSVGH